MKDPKLPYKLFQPWAQFVKILAQMVIGLTLFLALIIKPFLHAFFPQSMWLIYPVIINTPTLTIVSWGLALSAGIELSYMLFTPGPDEAVEPLILGFASAILLLISENDKIENASWEYALLILCYSGVLSLLFFVKNKFVKNADDVRENNMLESQITLLENLSKSLWELQSLLLAVSYNKIYSSEDQFPIALKDYKEKSWRLFKDVRREVSKAKHLASKKQYQRLLSFFKLIQEVDNKLMNLIETEASQEEWKKHHDLVLNDFPKKIDRFIAPLAEELKL